MGLLGVWFRALVPLCTVEESIRERLTATSRKPLSHASWA